MNKILLISGNYTQSSGQSIVNEQVISCVDQLPEATIYVARGGSRGFFNQFLLVIRVAFICLTRSIETVYYAPSRSMRGILRDLVLYRVARTDRKRLVVHWHGSDLNAYKARSRLANAGKNALVNAVHICLCDEHEKVVKSIWPRADVLILPNVLSDEYIQNLDMALLHDLLNRPRENLSVSIIGAVRYAKGIDVFCALAKQMAGHGYEFHVYGPILGDEEMTAEQIEVLLDEHKSFLRFHGPVFGAEKVRAFLKTDILVIPSRFEAYPLVIIEALAAGCWVVSNDVGFITSIHGWPKLQIVEGDLGDVNAFERVITNLDINNVVRRYEILGNIFRAKEQSKSFSEAIQKAVMNGGSAVE